MDRVEDLQWPSEEEIIRFELQPYFDAVVKEVARHVPEKGHGYRNSDWTGWFIERILTLAQNYNQDPDNYGEALDIGAMAAFAWSHQTKSFRIPPPTSQFTHESRRVE